MSEWFEMKAMFKRDQAEVIDVDGKDLFIRGSIDKLVIAQVKIDAPDSAHLHKGIMKMMERAKERGHLQDKEMMVLDDNIEFVRLSQVEPMKATVLEAQYQAYLEAKGERKEKLH